MRHIVWFALCTLALAGCPKPRTSAATQPTPAAFDAAKSDPKAIAVVDAAVAKLGGADKWTNLKQLKFTIEFRQDDKLKARFSHAWDRWNGRHYYEMVDMTTTGGKPEDVKSLTVRHELFDQDATPSSTYGGAARMRGESVKDAQGAKQQLDQNLYFLAMIYKLKDPGVMLAVDNAEVTIEGSEICKPSCTSIKVTFDPAVGKDTWFVSFNNESKLPAVIEMQRGGGRIGYELGGWTDAGGLKWPTRLQNLGLKTEVIVISDIKVGGVEEELYVPTVK